jgi:prevent-host-death family protein
MAEVGIRELKNGLSGYLHRVARGERITVTLRGKPVAEIRPAGGTPDPDEETWRSLAAQGKVTLARKPKPGKAPPLERVPGGASRYILEEREEGR